MIRDTMEKCLDVLRASGESDEDLEVARRMFIAGATAAQVAVLEVFLLAPGPERLARLHEVRQELKALSRPPGMIRH
jgi:hypothetical protein